MSDTMLDAALDYAAQGLPVLPLWGLLPNRDATGKLICRCGKLDCKRGKHPMGNLIRHGSLQATTHEPMIRHLWSLAPEANVGIATGAHAVGLDVDPREGGNEKLAELERKYGGLPKTWRARTGGGGDHYFFRPPETVEIKNFQGGKRGTPFNGIDLRGKGGVLVAAPSLHESGNVYQWVVPPRAVPIAPMPEWLVRALRRPRAAKMTAADWETLIREGAEAGLRHPSLAKLVSHLLSRNIHPQAVLELAHAFNEARCRPPKSRSEVFKIVNWCAGQRLPPTQRAGDEKE
jgi:bifunctional DNA primase/polymerase-like protein/primase-like protein